MRRYTDDFVDKIYQEIMNDETIKSISEVASRYEIPYYQVQDLRKQLYERYDKKEIQTITRKRMGAYGFAARIAKGPIIVSKETCAKMSASQIAYWENATNERREIARQSHFKNRAPKMHTLEAKAKRITTRKKNNKPVSEETKRKRKETRTFNNFSATPETRKKQSLSAIKRGNTLPEGFKHSKETIEILSKKTTQQWIDGVHKPRYKSKGHRK